jgi:hypothetical protein
MSDRYKPLYVDDVIERKYRDSLPWTTRRLKRVKRLGWLAQCFYYIIPYGRISVDSQLESRCVFPDQEWLSREFDLAEVTSILSVISKALVLPNHFLIPEDPLRLVITGKYDDLPHSTLVGDIRYKIGVDIKLPKLVELMSDANTDNVESLVREVIRLK